MGVDCVFAAENLRRVTIQDIEQDSLLGEFPGGKGRFVKDDWDLELEQPRWAYCRVEFINDLVVVHDGCRYWSARNYQIQMLEYLKRKCGGQAGVWGDGIEIDTECHSASTFNNEGWMQPIAEDNTNVTSDP